MACGSNIALIAVILSLLISSVCRAEPNLPSIGRAEQQGRLMYFPGPKPVIWYAPFAFTSRFDCDPRDPDPSLNRTCTLRIFNSLDGDDLSHIAGYATPVQGHEVLPIDATNGELVQKIDERYEKLDWWVRLGSASSERSLVLSDEAPYGTMQFWAVPGTEQRYVNAYATTGLGTFISEATINTERVEDYLELKNTAPLKLVLSRTHEGIRLPLLRAMMIQALIEGHLVANNMTADEALGIAYRHLIGTLFRRNRLANFEPKHGALESIGDTYLFVDETYSPEKMKCRAELLLKKDAQVSVNCERLEP